LNAKKRKSKRNFRYLSSAPCFCPLFIRQFALCEYIAFLISGYLDKTLLTIIPHYAPFFNIFLHKSKESMTKNKGDDISPHYLWIQYDAKTILKKSLPE